MSKVLAEEFRQSVESRGGKLLGVYTLARKPVKVQCGANHQLEISLNDLRAGQWCSQCNTGCNVIEQLLEARELKYQCDVELDGYVFHYLVGKQIIDCDGEDWTDEKRTIVEQKIEWAQESGYKLIRVQLNYPGLNEELIKALLGDETLYLLGEGYDWLDGAEPDPSIPPPSIPPSSPSIPPPPVAETSIKSMATSDHWLIEKLGPRSFVRRNPVPPEKKGSEGVIYVRVSTGRQADEGVSLETQEEKCAQRARDLQVYVRAVYRDEGLSAGSTEKRLALQRLIGDLKKGDYIFVYSLSRFSRDNVDCLSLEKIIRTDYGAKLIALDIDFDTRTTVGQAMFAMTSTFNEMERNVTRDRTRDAMQRLSITGRLKTKPRFGWKSPGKGLSQVPDEEQQKTITFIRELRKQTPTLGASAITRLLNDNDMPRSKGSRRFYPSQVKRIIDYEDL